MDTDKPPSTPSTNIYNSKINLDVYSHLAWWQRLLLRVMPWAIPKPQSATHLADIARMAHADTVINGEVHTMLDGVLSVADIRVRDIMIPRAQMVVVDREDSMDDMLKTVLESGHSRFPLMTEDREEAVGILLAKDVLRYVVENPGQNLNLREVCRGVKLVPESKRLNVLLSEFRAARTHLALVVDEYGGISGLVTIEDVLEQIVGNIDDEHDDEEAPNILQHYNGRFTVNALTDLAEFDSYFSSQFDAIPDRETVGGLLTQQFGYLPKRGEVAELEGFRFEVLKADGRRVHQVAVAPPPGRLVED